MVAKQMNFIMSVVVFQKRTAATDYRMPAARDERTSPVADIYEMTVVHDESARKNRNDEETHNCNENDEETQHLNPNGDENLPKDSNN